MKFSTLLAAVFTAVTLLSACGGGGGSDSPTPPPATNTAPVASAGADQSVLANAVVTLDGSKSADANSDPLTYAWTLSTKPAGSAAALANPTSAKPTFTADAAGAYVATLVVNDGKLDGAPDSVNVSVSVDNAAPVANVGPAQNVAVGSVVTLDGSASSDANSDPLTYAWTLTTRPAGSAASLSSASSAKPTFTADVAGTYGASLVVNDGKVNSSNAATVSITAAVANVAPVANAGVAQNVAVGASVALVGSASSDANGDPLTYAWTLTAKPAGSAATLSSTTAAKPTFMADVVGTYVASLIVNDGKVNSNAATVAITAATAPPVGGLSALYGHVTLNYKFDISSNVYTDITNFSSGNLNSDGTILVNFVVGSSTRAIACLASPDLNRPYMCLIQDAVYGTIEEFLFAVNGGQISNGLYEYCSAGVSVSTCTNDFLLSPDGTAWGSIAQNGVGIAPQMQKVPVSGTGSGDALAKSVAKAGTAPLLPPSLKAYQTNRDLNSRFEALRSRKQIT